jgi:quinolinate synthase
MSASVSEKSSMTELQERISRLKNARRAVILAHNYQVGEVQDIADFVGDSLELSRQAAATEAEVIVFCGVRFMAETAKILSPEKTVLLPDPHAGCPLCDMATAEEVRRRKASLPGVPVVSYVNTTADVKAESDICCTSSNSVKVVESLPEEEILFLPDRNLGSWTAEQTGKRLILWEGYCVTHQRILAEHILSLKEKHPEAEVVVHPECIPEVRRLANGVRSTSGILRYARESSASTIIVGTEIGILHRLKKENPGKLFLGMPAIAVCPNMKRISLEKVLWALEDMVHPIEVAEEIRLKAKRAIDRMLALP